MAQAMRSAPGPRRLDRRRERGPARALAVEADREAARIGYALDELPCLARVQRAGRVVDEDARRLQLAERCGALEQDVGRVGRARAVDEADRELLAARVDGVRRLAEVPEVVQRIVQAEDVDAVVGRALDEPPDEVARHGPGADEKPSAERDPEGRGAARAKGPDPLPGTLDAPAHRRVEAAAAGHLERGEPRPVEQVGHLEELRGLHPLGQGLLREEAQARVDQRGHGYTREM